MCCPDGVNDEENYGNWPHVLKSGGRQGRKQGEPCRSAGDQVAAEAEEGPAEVCHRSVSHALTMSQDIVVVQVFPGKRRKGSFGGGYPLLLHPRRPVTGSPNAEP